MTEPRPTYGPTKSWSVHATYEVVYRGHAESCVCQFSLVAPDGLHAANEALAMVKAATGQHEVVNLRLTVSLDL